MPTPLQAPMAAFTLQQHHLGVRPRSPQSLEYLPFDSLQENSVNPSFNLVITSNDWQRQQRQQNSRGGQDQCSAFPGSPGLSWYLRRSCILSRKVPGFFKQGQQIIMVVLALRPQMPGAPPVTETPQNVPICF